MHGLLKKNLCIVIHLRYMKVPSCETGSARWRHSIMTEILALLIKFSLLRKWGTKQLLMNVIYATKEENWVQ